MKRGVCHTYVDIYELANDNALDNLKSVTVDYMARNFSDFVNMREFLEDMTPVCLKKLLGHENVAAFGEQEVSFYVVKNQVPNNN